MKKYFLFPLMVAGTLCLHAQQRTTTQRPTTQAGAAKTFVLQNGKLGPIQAGQRFANIPATYAGLYDKYTRKTETMADEDGEWTVEYYQFTKAGKNIFRADIGENKEITGITLQAGSASIVKTQDGYYVGYPARTLFTQKRMQWECWYQGTSFATSGHYTYHVNTDDLTNEVPTNVNHFKPTAKITSIVYSAEVY